VSRRRAPIVLFTLAVAALPGAFVVATGTGASGVADPGLLAPWQAGGGLAFLAFAITVAVGEQLPLPKPGGGTVPLSVAVIATYAILVPLPVHAAAMAFAGAALAASVAAARHEPDPSWHEVVAATAGAWLAGALSAFGHELFDVLQTPSHAGESLGAMTVVAAAVVLGVPVWDAVSRRGALPVAPYGRRLRDSWMPGAALASAGLLGALVYATLNLLALPLVLLPLLAARAGLRRYATVRETHAQTVRAFSRLPEELGTVPPGHGVRVADICVAAARELALPLDLLTAVERAAHLHELGRIRGEPGELIDPDVVALDGASILREAGLDEVADIVGLHRHPTDELGPLETAARLVRLACDADRAIEEHGEAGLPTVARSIGDTEDLRVLGAITRVLAPQTV
jgi:hypothetical protein